ncbi:Putative bacteriophage-related protein [Roseibacterium elongatum DSM 19469]|uniref:Putative bacteriophage-related protein n=1 Tax=Roseicyclus elongatus DSM 19469 TaxID=1294273 RepID=W8S6I0_9RHOB|nr:DUF2924 domain-containing protein [Roseibacterium elongatum]AHM04456.1 Putative bacteriophage-related protein [Roseibacterium elongatum DSM 19469]
MIRVADLETMDRAALLAAWSDLFGSPAPKGISRTFLRLFIAFEIQARCSGGLSKKTLALVTRQENEVPPKATGRALKPGGRLLREWNGITHVVDVTETGFVWRGETWRSLSAIAREITGAHWSGPRFFGLNRKKAGS